MMTLCGVSAEKANDLRKIMHRMKIFERDIREHFVRASGPGGQNVNKVATCVVLHHIPTGTRVKSQQERSQGLNRYRARILLVAKIGRAQKAERQSIIRAHEKKRRQNRKRPRILKEKILEGKRQQSQKKLSRRKIRTHKIDGYL
jgi:peptide chain release factor